MCRALTVLCVAESAAALSMLKRAAASAHWELAPGATTEAEALRQLREERVHVLVVFGPFERLVAAALEASPSLRVVADRPMPGVALVVGSAGEVRGAVLGTGAGG
jgi:hypothetical protein